MKLARILILMVAVVALTGSANALITFDEFGVGTVITNQYAAQGVTFAGLAGSPPIITMDGGLQVLSPNPPYAGEFLAAYFTHPIDWVEFDAGYWDQQFTGIIKLYDPTMTLLGQFTNQTTWMDNGFNYEHFSFHGGARLEPSISTPLTIRPVRPWIILTLGLGQLYLSRLQ